MNLVEYVSIVIRMWSDPNYYTKVIEGIRYSLSYAVMYRNYHKR
jgi:hypothetical protein